VLVDAVSGDLSLHPGVRLAVIPDGGRQRQGPGGVDRKDRVLTLITIGQGLSPDDREGERRDCRTTNIGVPF